MRWCCLRFCLRGKSVEPKIEKEWDDVAIRKDTQHFTPKIIRENTNKR